MTEKKEEIKVEEFVPFKDEETILDNKKTKADNVIKNHIYLASGVGFVPVPLFDIAAVVGIQVKMIHDLAKLYNIPFSKNIVKSLLGSLVGGIGALVLSKIVIASFVTTYIRHLPGGNIINSILLPITAGASTYAVGKVFLMHFESGGTFLNFNLEKMKKHFVKMYEEGKNRVSS